MLVLVAVLVVLAFFYGKSRGSALGGTAGQLHSLPYYHGYFVALMVAIPLLLIAVLWPALGGAYITSQALSALPADLQPANELARDAVMRDIRLIASGAITDADRLSAYPQGVRAAGEVFGNLRSVSGWLQLAVALLVGVGTAVLASRKLSIKFRARNSVERIFLVVLIACSAVAILTTVGIVFSVIFETFRFFAKVPVTEFLFGTQWSPQTALRADQVGSSGAFGAVPLFIGTTLVMFIAMCVAGPIGLFAAIYMAEYASPRARSVAKPILEVLAGIPTVVFGFFAALSVAPLIRRWGESIGLEVASESALAAGIVMGVMIIPFMSSLSDDVINAVPQSLRDGSYAMGATKSETVKKVVLPAALPGIVSAFMLSVSRAVGETMIVVMAAGLAAHAVSWDLIETFNPLQAVTTVTVQIATLLVGDQEFDSSKTLSAFALGFVLFFFTLILNMIALRVVSRFKEQYD
ncbi:phosphate ABC transporter permease subunit PstC [Anderseniella sp. Alg231-50]|uniref:phosphate ABC transporter permease subunit PstC n=1 Tax=Anderseniella sp. Alg231-50 TaxID=1922226 RepID=UPI000D54EE64